MRITANTTNEQILAPVRSAVETMVAAATRAQYTDHQYGDQLVQAAQAVRNAEAVSGVQMRYARVCANNPARRLEFLADAASTGADDGWSGRGNDSRRAAHDAVLSWVRDEIWSVTHETREA